MPNDNVVHMPSRRNPRPRKTTATRKPPVQPGVIQLSGVKPQPVKWLVPGYFPLGNLVTFDGDPSTGKSTVMFDLAAAVSTGGPWPDEEKRTMKPRGVMILSAEDNVSNTIVPRLMAAGANLDRCIVLDAVPELDRNGNKILNKDNTPRLVSPEFPRDIENGTIEEVIKSNDIALVVVDVFFAFTAPDVNGDQRMRRLLSPLYKMAERTESTVVLIRHIPKSASKKKKFRGGGTIGITGQARAGFEVVRDEHDEDVRIMSPVKSNLAVEPPARAYRLVDAPEFGVARVEWQDIDADALYGELAAHNDAMEEIQSQRDLVADWLVSLIEGKGEDGSMPFKTIMQYARNADFSRSTLYRAAERVGIRSEVKGFPGTATWSLPDAE